MLDKTYVGTSSDNYFKNKNKNNSANHIDFPFFSVILRQV